MPVPFSARQQRTEQERMTPERIIQLARRPDGFRVSWRHRDWWLGARCGELVKAGLLRSERGKGETVYYANTTPED